MCVEVGLVAAVVGRPPDEVEASQDGPVDRWVVDDRDVKRLRLDQEERVSDPVPPFRVGAVEVYIWRRREERVEPLVRIERVHAGLSAVTEDGHEPGLVHVLRTERLRAVVLRAAHDVGERVLRVDGETLELERPETPVQR